MYTENDFGNSLHFSTVFLPICITGLFNSFIHLVAQYLKGRLCASHCLGLRITNRDKIPAFMKWQPGEHKQINTCTSDGEKTCSRENYKAGQVKKSVGWGTLPFICFILGS